MAFFIFSGMYYSAGAYSISTVTFNLIGVSDHVWGQWTPWFTIMLSCAIYFLVILAARFTKYTLYKDLQDEVSFEISSYQNVVYSTSENKHIFPE